jgi:hypothetical protein
MSTARTAKTAVKPIIGGTVAAAGADPAATFRPSSANQ